MPKQLRRIVAVYSLGMLLLLTGAETGHGEFIIMSAPFFLAAALLTLMNRIQ